MPRSRPGASRQSAPLPTNDEAALRDQLRRQVLRYCPRWLRDQAEDVAQVAWLRLADARRKNERNRAPGSSLLARVAYCATVDEIRRRRRRREVPVENLGETLVDSGGNQERAVRAREIGLAIRSCLAGVRPVRRVAVTLYLQGHSAPDTGTILGWSLKRAENMIFRGLADLRRCLAAKGMSP